MCCSTFCNLGLTHIASYKLPRQEIVCNVKHAACCFPSSSTLKQVGADLMDFVPAHLFLALEFALARRIDLSEMRRMLSGSPPGGETPFKAPGSPSMSLMFLHFHVIWLLFACLRPAVPIFFFALIEMLKANLKVLTRFGAATDFPPVCVSHDNKSTEFIQTIV